MSLYRDATDTFGSQHVEEPASGAVEACVQEKREQGVVGSTRACAWCGILVNI